MGQEQSFRTDTFSRHFLVFELVENPFESRRYPSLKCFEIRRDSKKFEEISIGKIVDGTDENVVFRTFFLKLGIKRREGRKRGSVAMVGGYFTRLGRVKLGRSREYLDRAPSKHNQACLDYRLSKR